MTSVLSAIDRLFERIRRRAADPALERLADEPIVPVDYGDDARGRPKGFRRATYVQTEELFEIPNEGGAASVKLPGCLAIHINVNRQGEQLDVVSGLHHGDVTWKTDNPYVFLMLVWCSQDPGVPDRLLTLVREELGREGFHLLPTPGLDRPAITTAERLSQLLPPEPARPVVPRPDAGAAPHQRPAGSFATPEDVLAAHNRAVAERDWLAYARCRTPASQAAIIGELFCVAEMGGSKCPELIRAIETPLKIKLFDASKSPGGTVDSLEAWMFLLPLALPAGNTDAADARIDEAVRVRVGDVPAHLADCLRQPGGLPEGIGEEIECVGIRVEGDRAWGSRLDRCPVPDAEDARRRVAANYLPRTFPVSFRRIGGGWLVGP